MNVNQLSDRFKTFAIRECKDSSPLYAYLSLKIAEDEELLQLSSEAQNGQPVPNLLFGAVQYLLLKGVRNPLRDYYPSIVKHSKPIEDSYPSFKDFCKLYSKEIKEILHTKLVQTNEVRRCAYLYPAFCFVYEKVNQPLALIEIGSSAGLQLLWDRYSYSYGGGEIYGNRDSNVHLTAEIRTGTRPPLHETPPPVTERIGIDLHVNDVSDEEDFLWLDALIWPEHRERRELFKKAAKLVKEHAPVLIEGDGVELLAEIYERIPDDHVICIFHTHVANQIPDARKEQLMDTIQAVGKERAIFHLYNNMKDRELHLDYYIEGKEYTQTIGATDGHGRWFEWRLTK